VVATEEVSTEVTRSPVIPTIVPTVKTPRIDAYGPYDGRDTEASTSPIHHFTEELIVFYASGCNRKDRARDPTRPGPYRCQSEPPTWLGPAYRVLTFVTYVIPLTIIGLVANVLTIFVNAMIALTIVTIVMSARISARAAAIVTFACINLLRRKRGLYRMVHDLHGLRQLQAHESRLHRRGDSSPPC
jgi:hypothetical protein